MKKNNIIIPAFGILISVMSVLPVLTGCSVVFTASITGSVIDKESWEQDSQQAGIADTEIFLYNDEAAWNEDYSNWTENDTRPDAVAEGADPNYFLSTVSAADGTFTFNGLIWNKLFPAYGKSGDRAEVYFLFYNPDYGVTENMTPVLIVSDVTNRLTPFKLERITNSATIQGSVLNQNTGGGVGAVNVNIYLATSLDGPEYPSDPDYQLTTAADGSYSADISYPRDLDSSGRVKAKITVDRNNYNCDAYDGDGTIDGASAADYLQTGLIEKDKTYTAEDIEIKQTEFTETLDGRYGEATTIYISGVTIWLFYSDDGSSAQPSTLPDGTQPNDTTYTQSQAVNSTATPKEGYFTFTNIQWTDTSYTTDKSSKTVWLYKPSAGEVAAGQLVDKSGYEQKHTVLSNSTNYVDFVGP